MTSINHNFPTSTHTNSDPAKPAPPSTTALTTQTAAACLTESAAQAASPHITNLAQQRTTVCLTEPAAQAAAAKAADAILFFPSQVPENASDAQERLKKALASHPRDAVAIVKLYRELIYYSSLPSADTTHYTQEAIKYFEEAFKSDKLNATEIADAAALLGDLHTDRDTALMWFEKAVAAGKKDLFISVLYLQIRKYGKDRAIALWEPRIDEMHIALALFSIRKKPEWATRIGLQYKQLSENAEHQKEKHYYLEQAIEYLKQSAVAGAAQNAIAAYELCKILCKDPFKNLEEAIKYLKLAATWKPKVVAHDCTALNSLAVIYDAEDNLKEADVWERTYITGRMKELAVRVKRFNCSLICLSTNRPTITALEISYKAPVIDTISKKLFAQLQKTNQISGKEPFVFNASLVPDGVCAGMVICFLSDCLSADQKNLKEMLQKTASKFQYKSGATAIALQHLYATLKNQIENNSLLSPSVDPAITQEKQARQKRHRDDWAGTAPLYAAYNLRLVRPPGFSIPGDLDDLTTLLYWRCSPDGFYELSFKVSGSYHAIAAIKQGSHVYLWDPSIGLIDCSKDNSNASEKHTIVEFRIAEHIAEFWSDKDDPNKNNHHLDFRRVEPA